MHVYVCIFIHAYIDHIMLSIRSRRCLKVILLKNINLIDHRDQILYFRIYCFSLCLSLVYGGTSRGPRCQNQHFRSLQ